MCLTNFVDEDTPMTQEIKETIDRTEQINSCLEYMAKQVCEMKDETLQKLCGKVLFDQNFINAYGSSDKHHAYIGGLAVHTSEVLSHCENMCRSTIMDVDIDHIITAVIYHDCGKIFDYKFNESVGKIDKTDHCKKIRHLCKSYAVFYNNALTENLDLDVIDKIGHIMLSHHGRKDWGSPIEPQTNEAFIVHFADMLSSRCSKNYYVRKINET